MNRLLLIGPPGTGKTTRLLNEVATFLDQGYSPREIAFVSFTRRAAYQARDMALQKFPNHNKDDFEYFRTIHSCCHRGLGLTSDRVMDKPQWLEIGEMVGAEMDGHFKMDEGFLQSSGQKEGDQFVSLMNLAAAKKITPQELYKELVNYEAFQIDRNKFLYFCDTARKYKEENGMLDFSDMLERGSKLGPLPHLKVAIIDEAQDLSAAQWDVVYSIFSGVDTMIAAGDDDQTIFEWSGADPRRFFDYSHTAKREILRQSWRCPKVVHDAAEQIIQRVSSRLPKDWNPREEEGGYHWGASIHAVMTSMVNGVRDDHDKDWMVLARNHYLLQEVRGLLRGNGIPYSEKGNRSINPKDILTIQAYEDLREGREVNTDLIKLVYNQMKGVTDIARGHKSGKAFQTSPQAVNWEWCEQNAGLQVERSQPWWTALSKFSNYKREYLRNVRRQGFSTKTDPKILIGTIHSVKGGEADNVVVLDEMSKSSYRSLELGPRTDEEHRVAYVAATRAKKNLIIHRSMRTEFYPYPSSP